MASYREPERMHFLLRLQLTSLKFSYVLLILHSKVPACRVTLRRPGELNAFASVLLGQGQSDLRAQVFCSHLRSGKIACMLLVCWIYIIICIYIYTLYPYIHYICIYMYVYCGLQLPFIAHHCLSLFLMFHGELRNLKPLRRAFRLMPRSILQGAHGSDICSYVPQLPDFLGAVKEQIDQEFNNSIASWPSWLVFSSFQLYLTTSQQLCLWIPASKRIKFQIFRCVTAPMTMSLRPNGTLRVTWVVFDESPNPASAKSLRVNLSRSF